MSYVMTNSGSAMGDGVANTNRPMTQSPYSMPNKGSTMSQTMANPRNSMPQGLKRMKDFAGQGAKRPEKPTQKSSDRVADKRYKIRKC